MPKETKTSPKQGLAIAALILNLILLPGIGSLIGGRVKDGIWQICLYIGGIVILILGIVFTATLIFAIIGIPMIVIGAMLMFAGWVWGIVTGIQLIQEAQ